MTFYVIRRILYMIPTMLFISFVTFVIINLPPGDFVTSYAATLAQQGVSIDNAMMDALRHRYGLDQSFFAQYLNWVWRIVRHGDFGQSFGWNAPVSKLIWSRMGFTLLLSISTLLLVWAVALPAGIYSAVRKYSAGDYVITFLGFIGLAIPSFLLALVLMYLSFAWFGQSVGGLFSPHYVNAPWTRGRVEDLLNHLWLPMIVLGAASTTSLIRIMRANLLDELHKPYVTTARAKGLSEWRLILKYPVRIALNPLVSTIGWTLPELISGSAIVSIVLSLPTAGPMLLDALNTDDMYLAGTFILLTSGLTVLGTLISDLLLAAIDPRIRYE
jgi:peptide/nickel transport system permease protein